MGLSSELLSQIAKLTTSDTSQKTKTTLKGTAVTYNGKLYVKLDGSDLLTPATTTINVGEDDRVTVEIEDHTATITDNITTPAANSNDVDKVASKISEFEIIVAHKLTADEIEAITATFESLIAKTANIENIDALKADIENLQAKYADLDYVNATDMDVIKADIENIQAKFADITDLSAEELEAINADINNLKAYNADFTYVSTDVLEAIKGSIKELDVKKLNATDAELKYANIDFSNIKEAAIVKLFSESGIIRDLVVSEGKITGELVGVTIKGDLIEGGTVVADKLVVKGEDGIYYKLNTDGETIETEQTDYNSLNGSIITAKSITATKIAVDDLVAFDATIGGFKITKDSIYSGVKSSVNNTTRGIYMDNAGQLAFGDSDNFLKYYKDDDGSYKLEISAGSIRMVASKKTVEEALSDITKDVDDLKDGVTPILRIESSRGTVFKNSQVSTVLSVVIYHGNQRITDSATMKEIFGSGAYLQWKWQRLDEDSFGIISSSDSRFGDEGFTFVLSPDDVDTKVTFMCELIV